MNPMELRQKFYNLATVKTPWYKIMDQADGPVQIHIFNSIGGGADSTSADAFIAELSAISGPVELRINSEGGEVFQAKPIYNALSRRSDVSVVVDGIAASAASFIAMAASPGKLFMSAIGTMMIHDGMVMAAGSAADLRSLAAVLDKESDTIAGIYARRTGRDASYFRDKMRTETWYNAEEALEEGLCDGIIDARTGRITNSAGTRIRNAASHPYVGPHDHMHEPMTGGHSHNHAAFGHEDGDDGIHAHSHSHDNDASHEHSHMSHTHDHDHGSGQGAHQHAHDAGDGDWGPHSHPHTHHAGYDPDHDGDDDSTAAGDTDHDFAGAENAMRVKILNQFGQEYLDKWPEAVFYDRTFTTEERKRLAKSGAARSDGSYPIETCSDAQNARRAYGRSNKGDRSAVASHIRSREKALGGCGREPFSPGSSSNLSGVEIDAEFVTSFTNQIGSLRALRGA